MDEQDSWPEWMEDEVRELRIAAQDEQAGRDEDFDAAEAERDLLSPDDMEW